MQYKQDGQTHTRKATIQDIGKYQGYEGFRASPFSKAKLQEWLGGETTQTKKPVSQYTGVSIVDYLKSVGQASDYGSRSKLAQKYGIGGYAGTAQQNTQLLNLLKGGQQPQQQYKPQPVQTAQEKQRQVIKQTYEGRGAVVPEKYQQPIQPQPVDTSQKIVPTNIPQAGTSQAGVKADTSAGGGTPAAGGTGGVDMGQQLEIDKEARNNLANEANESAQQIFDNLPDIGDDTDMRNSAKILKEIQDSLDNMKGDDAVTQPPESMVDLFATKKAELGIEPLENELAGLDADIDRINAELFVQAEEAGEQLVSTREISRTKGAIQKRAEREIALLNIERSAVARQLGNKIDSLKIIMDLTDKDFDNTSAYYEKEFNRNVTLYNLMSGAEEKVLTHIERARDDARANLTTIYNSLKDDNLDYDNLNADQKLKVKQLEVQAGFPEGFLSQIATDEPDKKVQTVTSRTDATGNSYYDVLMVGENGELTVKTIFKGTVAPKESDAELADIEDELEKSRGEVDGYADPYVYEALRTKAGIGPDEFNKRFKHLLSPQERLKLGIDKAKDTGEMDPVLLKDLKDAILVIEQGASRDEIKRRFLEKHPKEEKQFNSYLGL